jgi:hypothetical protein
MDKFVCVRVVEGWGLDLSLFQFDYWLTWAVFLMNSDRAIYGRFSWRGSQDVEALRVALRGALDLHAKWPANRDELAAKIGPELPWKRSEDLPAIAAKNKFREADGHKGCIHCHNVAEGLRKSFKATGKPIPERLMAPWPTPDRAGFTLAFKDPAAVTEVQKGTPADKAGLKAGDRLVRLGGQPLLSIADVEWALYRADDAAPLKAQVQRDGRTIDLELALPAGWRSKE